LKKKKAQKKTREPNTKKGQKRRGRVKPETTPRFGKKKALPKTGKRVDRARGLAGPGKTKYYY